MRWHYSHVNQGMPTNIAGVQIIADRGYSNVNQGMPTNIAAVQTMADRRYSHVTCESGLANLHSRGPNNEADRFGPHLSGLACTLI